MANENQCNRENARPNFCKKNEHGTNMLYSEKNNQRIRGLHTELDRVNNVGWLPTSPLNWDSGGTIFY